MSSQALGAFWFKAEVGGESYDVESFAETVVRVQTASDEGKDARVLVGSGHGPAAGWSWNPREREMGAVDKLTRAFEDNRKFLRITLPYGESVPVTLAKGVSGLDACYALVSRPFLDWLKLDQRFALTKIWIDQVDMAGKRALFTHLRYQAANASHPQVAVLRGDSVAVWISVTCAEREYALLVCQPRGPIGNWEFAEVVAGMLDGGKLGGAMAKEIFEEAGITIREEDLMWLTEGKGIASSCGLLDERYRISRTHIEMMSDELEQIQGRMAGVQNEDEHTTVLVVPLEYVMRYIAGDAKSLIAYYMYMEYKARLHRAMTNVGV